MSKFMFGCDPEVFLRNKVTGSFVSAAGKFPGTKDSPHALDQGAVQVDGLALEFNIDATDDPAVFHDRVRHLVDQLDDMVKQVDKNLIMEFIPYAEFEAEYFESLDGECKILGCDPDFDERGNMNQPPSDLINRPIRTAAGHVHIGWDNNLDPLDVGHRADCAYIARHFGQVDGDFSPENLKRQRYYGASGAHRPKTYGVELRCSSNVWVIGRKNRRDPNNPYGMAVKLKEEMELLG